MLYVEFRTNKPSDVISTLVSIYDSKDLFVKELQVLLAQRLLAISDAGDRVEREVPSNIVLRNIIKLMKFPLPSAEISRF